MTMPNAPVDQGNPAPATGLTPVSMPANPDYVHVNDFRRLQSTLDRQIAAERAQREMLQTALVSRDEELTRLRRHVEELGDSLLPEEDRQTAQMKRLRDEVETLRTRPAPMPMPTAQPDPQPDPELAKRQYINSQLGAFGLTGQEPGLAAELARAQNREQAVAAMARAQGRLEAARAANPQPANQNFVPPQTQTAAPGQLYQNPQGQLVDAYGRPVNPDGTPIYAPGQGAPAFMQPNPTYPRVDTGGPAPMGAQPRFDRDTIQSLAKSRSGAQKIREMRDQMARNNPAVQTS